MIEIQHVRAREIYDSRGNPTVEVDVHCARGGRGRAIAPSGASTGKFEAVELRDSDASRLDGTGVLHAVRNVNDEIAQALVGTNADDQAGLDARLIELDGTENKSRLGANAILAVSLATAYSAAAAKGVAPVLHFRDLWQRVASTEQRTTTAERTAGLGQRMSLPLPMVNMISGGLHAGCNLEIQDFLVLPVGADSYRQAFEWIVTVYRRLGTILSDAGYEGRLVGDEGGFGPRLERNEQALEFVVVAIEAAGLRPGEDMAIGLDVAATHFFQDGKYRLRESEGGTLGANEFSALLEDWVARYPIISIEDALAEEDWDGWKNLSARLANRVQLIGDDLFVTNAKRLARGINENVGNSVLIKLNQIGTLSETFKTLRLAIDNGYWPVVSARSGETEDVTIADLVVATGAGQLKVGSVVRSERLAKYNQLLRLEEQLGDQATYVGGKVFDALTRGSVG